MSLTNLAFVKQVVMTQGLQYMYASDADGVKLDYHEAESPALLCERIETLVQSVTGPFRLQVWDSRSPKMPGSKGGVVNEKNDRCSFRIMGTYGGGVPSSPVAGAAPVSPSMGAVPTEFAVKFALMERELQDLRAENALIIQELEEEEEEEEGEAEPIAAAPPAEEPWKPEHFLELMRGIRDMFGKPIPEPSVNQPVGNAEAIAMDESRSAELIRAMERASKDHPEHVKSIVDDVLAKYGDKAVEARG